LELLDNGMGSSDDDDELKMALALSMQQTLPPANKAAVANEAIDLTSDSDDEDEDVRRAIALSLQENVQTNVAARDTVEASALPSIPSNPIKSEAAPPDTRTVPPQGSSSAASISGFDRKAMEAERLARLGKRKRDPLPERPSKQIATTPSIQPTKPASISPSIAKSTVLQYPKGAIKRTFATKYPRTNDITIDEVLQADIVDIAVISSFMWDSEWLWKKVRVECRNCM
jgi:hypothetical protein